MVAGQAYDLEAESREVSAEELEQIHRLKTGALIIAAARCGAIIADASEAELAAITDYAAQLGLLFQITDDLLDVTATAETLGKTPGKDQRSQKATYPALYGIEATREHLAERARSRLRLARRHSIGQPSCCAPSPISFLSDRRETACEMSVTGAGFALKGGESAKVKRSATPGSSWFEDRALRGAGMFSDECLAPFQRAFNKIVPGVSRSTLSPLTLTSNPKGKELEGFRSCR